MVSELGERVNSNGFNQYCTHSSLFYYSIWFFFFGGGDLFVCFLFFGGVGGPTPPSF